MKYVNKTTNQVVWISEIRKQFPNMSIPSGADLSELGYVKLIEVAAPVQEGYEAVEVAPVNYTQTWELVPVVKAVPQEIRMAQCRAQLIIDGKDDDVEALLNGITDPIKQKLYRAYFEYEPIVKRDNPMINEMAPVLGIDLDVFFEKASEL